MQLPSSLLTATSSVLVQFPSRHAHNYNCACAIPDASIFIGDPTKLGLGLFSILFDMVFMVQHYILYPHREAQTSEEHDKLIQ